MYLQANTYKVQFGSAAVMLNEFVSKNKYETVFILVDENVLDNCLHKIQDDLDFNYVHFCISAGESNKNIATANMIWEFMLNHNLDRHALMINLGGGVIGDMGGFCASTFMRGIDFIQVPTTLLAQVDASVGGKLAIDFMGYKNIIGLFNNPKQVLIDTIFLKTLPTREIYSGFAEMLKHGLIQDAKVWETLSKLNLEKDIDWKKMVYKSIAIKNKIVTNDPKEKAERKMLNFGHSIGHAVESELLNDKHSLLHGESVIVGMICASNLSVIKGLLNSEVSTEICRSLFNMYPNLPIRLPSKEKIISRLKKDKKNRDGKILFSLLVKIGAANYDIELSEKELVLSFDYYNSFDR